MADDLWLETLSARGGGHVADALETLHAAALHGFTTEWEQGGVVERWPASTGHDLASLVALRDSLERIVLPSLNAAISGRPGPFNTDIDGDLDPSVAIVAVSAVT